MQFDQLHRDKMLMRMREDVMQNESETRAQMSHPLKEATVSDKMLMRMREVVMLMRKMPNNMQLR